MKRNSRFEHRHENPVVADRGDGLYIYSHEHTHTHRSKCNARKWKMQAKLSICVTQFLLLTALCDRKINPATKLIYLFLSLALLLIPSVSQIGFSYNPERYTFLQPNLKTCSEKCLGCRLALFASMFHLGSIFFCSTLSLLLTLCDLFKAAFTGWGKSRLPLGALLPFTDPLLTGSFSSAK